MPEISLLAAFLAGLLGGVHCVGMCGGLVAAFSLQAPGAAPRPALHLAANLGRMTSYAIAGAAAGALGSTSLLLQSLFPVERALYALANLMLIGLGLYLADLWRGVLWLERAGGLIWRGLQPVLGRLLPISNVGRAFAAGTVWGWLPCGLVYSMLVMALASGGAASGALLLLAFGAGTLPNLLLMGLAANRLQPLLRRRLVRLFAGLAVAAMGLAALLRLP